MTIPPNRRRMRSQLGSRSNRRSGTKSRIGRLNARPAARMRVLLARYARGEVDHNGREI